MFSQTTSGPRRQPRPELVNPNPRSRRTRRRSSWLADSEVPDDVPLPPPVHIENNYGTININIAGGRRQRRRNGRGRQIALEVNEGDIQMQPEIEAPGSLPEHDREMQVLPQNVLEVNEGDIQMLPEIEAPGSPPEHDGEMQVLEHAALPEVGQPVLDIDIHENVRQLHDSFYALNLGNTCSICNERWFDMQMTGNGQCIRCYRSKKKLPYPRFSLQNNTNPALEVPAVLKQLTLVEETLISIVSPMVRVIKLPRSGIAYSGHVISFPKESLDFCSELPRKTADILLIRRADQAGEHRDFKIRRPRVLAALLYLFEYHRDYRERARISAFNIQQLPEDGYLEPEQILTEPHDEPSERNQVQPWFDDDQPYLESTIPLGVPTRTNDERVREAIAATDNVFEWPSVRNTPADEYNYSGLLAQAFPTLFPDGHGDFTRGQEYHEVSLASYIQHLFRYADGRFRRHRTFRYFIFNYHHRKLARGQAAVFIYRNPTARNTANLEDLHKLIEAGRHDLLVQHCMAFSATIKGSIPYWRQKASQLQSFVKYCEHLGNPVTVFFTFSSADHLWSDLKEFIRNSDPESTVHNDPGLTTSYIHKRFQLFFDMVLSKILDIEHFWYRTEFQARGACHFHGVASIKSAPDCWLLCEEGQFDALIHWIEQVLHITAWHPDVDSTFPNYAGVRDRINPLTKDFRNVLDQGAEAINLDYRHVINSCQRHFCQPSYCVRRGKCRFGYPRSNCEQTRILKDPTGRYTVEMARNDDRLNTHIKIALLAWRANMDISIVFDPDVVRRYVTKYAAKHERSSTSYNDILKTIVEHLLEREQNHIGPLSVFQRLINRTMVERDFTAQEVTWLCLGGHLVRSSVGANFIPISMDGAATISTVNRRLTVKTAPIRRYAERSPIHADLSFYDYVRLIDGVKPRNKIAVPQPMPMREYRPHDTQYHENYCRDILVLYKPWALDPDRLFPTGSTATREFEIFLNTPQCPTHIQRDVFRYNVRYRMPTHEQADDNETRSIQNDNSDSDWEYPLLARAQTVEDLERQPLDEWMFAVAQYYDDRTQSSLQSQPLPPLYYGDDDYDWTSYAVAHPQYDRELPDFLNQIQQIDIEPERTGNPFSFRRLHGLQRLVFAMVANHDRLEAVQQVEPLRLIVCGTAGTGKSQIIKTLVNYFSQYVRLAAPSGVAAFNIGGTTIHAMLKIPINVHVRDTLPPLSGETLRDIQRAWIQIKYVIIDEMSFIGQRLLYAIDRRLREINPVKADLPFGGYSILLFGDTAQLPPVKDSKLYAAPATDLPSIYGSRLYRLFTDVIKLTNVFRQNIGPFLVCLEHVRDAIPTNDDLELLRTRLSSRLEEPIRASFSSAPHLFPTRRLVEQYNLSRLADYMPRCLDGSDDRPAAVAKIPATNVGQIDITTIGSDRVGGLSNMLLMKIGARVMLRANLCVPQGLVNGALGTVFQMVYAPATRPPHPPFAILVQFDNYSGPSCVTQVDRVVPILRQRAAVEMRSGDAARIQFPLTLAWGLTVHKSQGLTLERVVVDLGNREFAAGLTFVALSRVKSLDGLLIKQDFSNGRLRNRQVLEQRFNEDLRLQQLSEATLLNNIGFINNYEIQFSYLDRLIS